MQLIRHIVIGMVCAAVFPAAASAQSVTPLRKQGTTLTDKKAFYVSIGNPYKVPMVFSLAPMEADYATPADRVVVRPAKLKLGVNQTKRVIFMFEIQKDQKERKVALCVSPEGITGPIQPRVCGTYLGKRVGQ
jgi:hypothetical protein